MCGTLIGHWIQLHNTVKGAKATIKDRSYSNRAASLLWISATIFSPHLFISYLFELLILLSCCSNVEACNENGRSGISIYRTDKRGHATSCENVTQALASEQWSLLSPHVLDAVCGGVWYDYMLRPAYKNLTRDQAANAVKLCNDIISGDADLIVLNKQSLQWRGKTGAAPSPPKD